MKPTPPDLDPRPAPFDFFPPGMTHTPGEGRDPRVPLEMDSVSRNFPTANQIAAALFLVSLALFLASDEARYVTGHTLKVDAGRMLK